MLIACTQKGVKKRSTGSTISAIQMTLPSVSRLSVSVVSSEETFFSFSFFSHLNHSDLLESRFRELAAIPLGEHKF